jgi:hypothetical protein
METIVECHSEEEWKAATSKSNSCTYLSFSEARDSHPENISWGLNICNDGHSRIEYYKSQDHSYTIIQAKDYLAPVINNSYSLF